MKSHPYAIVPTILALFCTTAQADWSGRFSPPGVYDGTAPGQITTITRNNGKVYIAGRFDHVGLVAANNIACCDGGRWVALDEGTEYPIGDMLALDHVLYASTGHYNDEEEWVYGVARWDDGSWSFVGNAEFDAPIYCLGYHGYELYAGGAFRHIDGADCGHVVVWRDGVWSEPALNSPYNNNWPSSYVSCLESSGGLLWAGGDFDTVTPYTSPFMTALQDESWIQLGEGIGFDDIVDCISGCGSRIYAGGAFLNVDGEYSPFLGRVYTSGDLDGFSGSMPTGPVTALLTREHSEIIATDYDLRVYGTSGWSSPYGEGFGGVIGIDDNYDELWVAGELFGSGGYVDAMAHWNGSAWTRVGAGLARTVEARDYVNTLTPFDGDLIAGGYFEIRSFLDDAPDCNNIGRFDGRDWLPMSGGFNDEVQAVMVWDGQLIAGGDFDYCAGTGPVSRLAYWDGAFWQTLEGGANAPVLCMTESGGDLVVGGHFTSLNGVSCARIGRLGDSGWEALGAGANGVVTALDTYAGWLYAGGGFTSIGGVTANHVAYWDGSAWHAMGDGLDGTVYALCRHDGDLYAGMRSYDPGNEVASLFRWDGSAWHEVCDLMCAESYGEIRALVSTEDGLVAGGAFHTIDNENANHAAILSDGTWSAFDGGVTGGYHHTGVHAIADYDGSLFFGGDFTHAGDKVSCSIASWFVGQTPVVLRDFAARASRIDGRPRVDLSWRIEGNDEARFDLTAEQGGVRRSVVWGSDDQGWFAIDDDPALLAGGEVRYTLQGRLAGEDWLTLADEMVTVVGGDPNAAPGLSAWPNPANPMTAVRLEMPVPAADARVGVYDLRGRCVKRLHEGPLPAGPSVLLWSGEGDDGRPAPSGVYFVRAAGTGKAAVAKVSLVR